MPKDDTPPPLTAALAGLAAGPVDADAATRRVVALSALDWLAVGRAGADQPVARILHAQAEEEGGTPQAHLFGGGRAPARMAALVNGTTAHALDYDDTHFAHIGHPSVAVLPAALAMAERQGAGLAAMLEAALLGMEISVRVGLWLGRGHYQIGFHQTATAGCFGAAAAAGRLAGLDAAGIARALGLAATRAAGLKAQFGTMGKPYNAGLAAAGGIEAALLVARGFLPAEGAMEGPQGFAATHHGAEDRRRALDGLGESWLIADVSPKFHACCHGLHAALEAARDLPLAPGRLERLTVHTHPRWMSVCDDPAPATGLAAKFSYRAVLALHMTGRDTARLDSYADALCRDPAQRALWKRIAVVADPALPETAARLEARLEDGSRHVAQHDLAAPLPLALRRARLVAKAEALIGPRATRAALDLLEAPEGHPAAALGRLMAG